MRDTDLLLIAALLAGGGVAYYHLGYKASRSDVIAMMDALNKAGSDWFVGLQPHELEATIKKFQKLSKKQVKFLQHTAMIPENEWSVDQSLKFARYTGKAFGRVIVGS